MHKADFAEGVPCFFFFEILACLVCGADLRVWALVAHVEVIEGERVIFGRLTVMQREI